MRIVKMFFVLSFCLVQAVYAQSVFKYEALSSVQNLYDVELVDINADGYKDFIISTSSSLVWHENDGSATFVEHSIQGMHSSYSYLVAGDTDNDGDVDFFCYYPNFQDLVFMENDGAQNFTSSLIDNYAGDVNELILADLDSDGDLDLVTACEVSGGLKWYENDSVPSNSFTLHNIAAYYYSYSDVDAIDMDKDGDIDLVASSEDYDRIVWLENDSSQNFTLHNIYSSANGALSVFPVDIDGDNDIDILSASFNDDKIIIHYNDSLQNFTQDILSDQFGSGSVEVIADDLDGDGDMDIITGNYRKNTLRWFEQSSLGNFKLHYLSYYTGTIGSSQYNMFLEATDLDNDNDLDILYNTTADFITLYRNTECQSLQPIALPYIESWDDATMISQCSKYLKCESDYRWYFNSGEEGRGQARWGSHNSSISNGIVLDASGSGNKISNFLDLEMDLSNYTSSSNLELSFKWEDFGDENDTNDAVWIRAYDSLNWLKIHQLYPENDDSEVEVIIDLDSALSVNAYSPGSQFNLRFGQEGNSYANYGNYYDGILFRDIIISNCPRPRNILISNVSHNSALVEWSGNVALDYEVEYGISNFIQGQGTVIQGNGISHVISGLESGTSYEFYLRNRCTSVDASLWDGPYEFQTLCEPVEIINACLPNLLPNTCSSNSLYIRNLNDDSGYWKHYNSIPSDARIDLSDTENDDWFILRGLKLSGNEELVFDLRTHHASRPALLKVKLSMDETDTMDFVHSLYSNDNITNMDFESVVIDLSTYSGTCYIAFKVDDIPQHSNTSLSLDNICVRKKSCAALTPLHLPFALGVSGMSGVISNSGPIKCDSSFSLSFIGSHPSISSVEFYTNSTNTYSYTRLFHTPPYTHQIYNDSVVLSELVLTFDLSAIASSSNMQVEFDLQFSAFEDTNNALFLRDNDQSPWLKIVYLNKSNQGLVSLDLDSIIQLNGLQLSSSFQFKFSREENYNNLVGINISDFNIFNCNTPDSVEVLSTSHNSANLVWSIGNNVTIEYGNKGFDIGQGIRLNNQNNNYANLNNLQSNNQYEFYLRDSCSPYSYSKWVGPFDFKTFCDDSILITDLNETFDSGLTTGCWSIIPNPSWGLINNVASINARDTTNWLISPPILLNDHNYLCFDYNGYRNSGLSVAISTTGKYINDFNQVLFDTLYMLDDFDERICLDLDNPNDTIYIGFKNKYNGHVSSWKSNQLDNIVITECASPENITSELLSASSVKIDWCSFNNNTSYQLSYNLFGASSNSMTYIDSIVSTSHIVAGLLMDTSYNVWVRGVCSVMDSAQWGGPISFQTGYACPCDEPNPISLPFVEDWETFSGILQLSDSMRCDSNKTWHFQTIGGSGRVNYGDDAHYMSSGIGALDFETLSGTADNSADLTLNLSNYVGSNSLYLSFDLANFDLVEDSLSGIWINADSSKSWINIYNPKMTYQRSNEFSDFGIFFDDSYIVDEDRFLSFSNYDLDSILNANNQTIDSLLALRFRYLGEDKISVYGQDIYGGLAFDNIILTDCAMPENLTISSIATSSAHFNWSQASSVNSVDISYGSAGIEADSGYIFNANGTSYTFNGLLSGQSYSVYVRNRCASGAVNPWVGPISFSTRCGALQPISLPYFETWERSGAISTEAAMMFCDSIALWSFVSDPDGKGYGEWGINQGGKIETSSDEGGAIVLSKTGASGTLVANKAILEVDLSNYVDSTNLYLDFNYEYCHDKLHTNDAVWIRESDSAEWIKIHQVIVENYGFFCKEEIAITDVDLDTLLMVNGQSFSSKTQIAFGNENLAAFWGLLYDDIQIYTDACASPDSLSVEFLDSSSAVLSWAGSASSYNIKYGDKESPFDSMMLIENVDSNDYLVLGIDFYSSYEYYVQSSCIGSNLSKWVGPLEFGNNCPSQVVPTGTSYGWRESFSYNSNTRDCWLIRDANFDQSSWSFNSEARFVSNTLNDDWLISPAIELTGNEGLFLDYAIRPYSTYQEHCSDYIEFEILVSSLNTVSSFTDTLLKPSQYFINDDIPNTFDLSAYSGKVFIAFHIKGGTDNIIFEIDEVKINSRFDANPEFVSVDHSTAIISWDTMNFLQSVDIEYGPSGFGIGNGTLLSNFLGDSIHLTNLLPDTEYDFYLRNNFNGYVTNWKKLDFKTTIEPINSVPWCEYFDANSSSMNSWQQINRDGSQTTWDIYTGSAGGTSRFQKIASDVDCADDWLVTPTIGLSGNNYLKFTYINMYGSAPIEIWLSDKGSHPDSFDYNILPLTDLYLNYGNDEMIVDLSGFIGVYNIAWRFRGGKSDINSYNPGFLGIDNICVREYCQILLPVSLPFYEDWDTISGVGDGIDTIYCDDYKKWYHMGKMYYGSSALYINNGTGAFTISTGYGSPQSILTLNMSNYINANDLELSFAYSGMGYDDPSNAVFIRGSINDSWVKAKHINLENLISGVYEMFENVDLDSVLSTNGQSFSETFQIGFSQYTGDLHFDDISIYECPISSSSITQSVCDSFVLNDSVYFSSGQYLQKLQNVDGCDSLVSLDLTVHYPSSAVLDTSICESLSINGQTYSQSGTYYQTINSSAGCDSNLTINLTILNKTNNTIVASSCSTYTLNGQSYSQSGVYTQTFTNSIGCDSVLTLDLTISTIPDLIISGADSVSNGQTATYSVANNSGSSYAWTVIGGSIVSGNGTYSISVEWTSTGAGVIKVIETDVNGCVGDESLFDVNIDWGLNIDEFNGEGIDIYPNPFSEFTSIKFSNESNDKFDLLIYDLSGKTVGYVSNIQGSVFRLNKGNLNSGIYLIELRSLDKSFKAKALID